MVLSTQSPDAEALSEPRKPGHEQMAMAIAGIGRASGIYDEDVASTTVITSPSRPAFRLRHLWNAG